MFCLFFKNLILWNRYVVINEGEKKRENEQSKIFFQFAGHVIRALWQKKNKTLEIFSHLEMKIENGLEKKNTKLSSLDLFLWIFVDMNAIINLFVNIS